jgi:hypothetical protein
MTPTLPAQNRNRFAVLCNIGAPLFTLIGAAGYFSLLQYPYRIDYLQEADFNKTTVLTLASLTGGFVCGLASLGFYRRNSNFLAKVVSLGCILLAAGGLVMSFSTPCLAVKSVLTAKNICINNARQIEAAKADWAQKHGATNGVTVAWIDIAPYFTNGFPKCPEGGNYELGKVGEPVTCSNPQHRIQDQQY